MRAVSSGLVRELFARQLRIHLHVLLHGLDVGVSILEVRAAVLLERRLLVGFHAMELGSAFRRLLVGWLLVDEVDLCSGVLVLELAVSFVLGGG